jgi:hypothetical protein
MFPAILVGLALLVVSVVTSGLSAAVIIRGAAYVLRHGYAGMSVWKNAAALVATTLVSTAGHLFQIALWGAVFMACGEFERFGDAFYHSASNYTALGYGDLIMSARWRLLGPLEALTGVLLLGFSVGLVFTVMSRMIDVRLQRERALLEASRRGTPDV